MAKFETRVKTDIKHLMEYVHNSLRPDYLPADFIDEKMQQFGDVTIIARKYFADVPTMVIYTYKENEEYIYVDILQTGIFTGKFVFEDGGEKYENYLHNMIEGYNPLAPMGNENRFFSPPKEKKKSFLSKLFDNFKR